ncbi:hypothetical protein L6232_25650, partial [Shewanella sp. C31]|nr:hypothetical protein [Shewanella electrica]
LTFELWVSPEGELRQERFYLSWVRARRLTYQEALAEPALRPLGELAQTLQGKRLSQGALDIGLPEVKVRVEEGEVRLTPVPPS